MGVKSFLKLVEIRTKIASVIPFLLGTLYTVYHFHRFNIQNFFILFVSIICFDMATTAINNYFDYKSAVRKYGYNYEAHNAIVSYKLKEGTVISVIFILLAIAIGFGLLLVSTTNILVLIVGVISFAVGICYSFGPVPISRTPFGEVFSGLFMGFIIIFLSVYVHIFDLQVTFIGFENYRLTLSMNILEVVFIFLFSIPTVCGIANIMLANNICDMEDDIENRRYTLPIYVGKKNALRIFKSLYYITYLDVILMVLLQVTPLFSLLVLLTLIPVYKNINVFYEKQSKKDTFDVSVKNSILINGSHIIILGITVLIESVLNK